MGLVLDHVVTTKSGSLHYRRRVPKDVAGIITKREFKRKLGDSRKEATGAYLRYHAQVGSPSFQSAGIRPPALADSMGVSPKPGMAMYPGRVGAVA